MKRKQINQALAVALALIMVFSSYLTICASDTDDLQLGNNDTEEKVYANASINDDFAEDTVLVVLKNQISIKCDAYSASDFVEVNASSVEHLSAPLETRIKTTMENIKYSAQSGEKVEIEANLNINEFYQVLKIKLSDPSKDRVLEAIKILEKNNDVLYAGPDYYLTYASQNYDYDEYQTYMSNFAEQWAYSHIQLDEAWQYMDSISLSNTPISVGVIDSGIYANHPALDINTNNSNTYGDNTETGAGVDTYYHGTQVAGIIQGVARNVDIISLKVSESWLVKSSDVHQVFTNIDKDSIPIVNFSLYWKNAQGETLSTNYDYVIALAMNQYGGFIVCAAGNEGADIDYDNSFDYYPIQHEVPKMIVVGASTQTDERKSDSNYGETYVDVFAPGVDLYTTTYTGGYTNSAEKTSLATPWVTGLAAMLMMVDEDLSPEQIINIIVDTVDKDTIYNHSNYVNPENGADLDELEDLCRSDGRINAYQAVKQAHQSRNCSHTTLTYSRTEISHIRRCTRCNLAMEAEEMHT